MDDFINNVEPEYTEHHLSLTPEQIANFRQKLRFMRKHTKITQDELADRLNIVHQDVSALERGRKKVTPEIVNAAANAFGVSTDDMLKSSGPSDDSKNYCLRLLEISQIIYNTDINDVDRQIIDRAIKMLESVVFA